MVIAEIMMTAIHEVGHAIARLEIERTDRSLTAYEPFDGLTIEPDASTYGRAFMPARLAYISFFDSARKIRRFRAERRRLLRTRKAQTSLDRAVEADVIELLAGPIAEERARLGRPLGALEIERFADEAGAAFWMEEAAMGDLPDDMALVQRRMHWLGDGRCRKKYNDCSRSERMERHRCELADKLVRCTIDVIGAGSDHDFQKLIRIAAVLFERRSMDAEEFTAAWNSIRAEPVS